MAQMRLPSLALLALLTLAEIRLFDRLLVYNDDDMGFAVASVEGVTARRPVSPSWQQRVLGPWAVATLARVVGDVPRALALFGDVLLAAANFLLFFLRRRRGDDDRAALIRVALFGFAHALLAYRLEYPWDWIDVLIFFAFGDHVARGRGLLAFAPWLLVGLFNHETILYVPLWFLLAPVEKTADRKQLAIAALTAIAIGGAILALRHALYLGPPDLPGQTFEVPTPIIDNHLHFVHNARALVDNFADGHVFQSLALLAAIAFFVSRAIRRSRAAIWSLIVIATVFAFGYVNETRHYLPLYAFWFAY